MSSSFRCSLSCAGDSVWFLPSNQFHANVLQLGFRALGSLAHLLQLGFRAFGILAQGVHFHARAGEQLVQLRALAFLDSRRLFELGYAAFSMLELDATLGGVHAERNVPVVGGEHDAGCW